MSDRTDDERLVPMSGDGRVGPLLRELFAGADAGAPVRPGRYLETPQRLGLLPTLHFWNRKDVWKNARWFMAPVVAASMVTSAVLGSTVSPWLFPLVGLVCGAPVVLAHGMLERYVRSRVQARVRRAASAPAEKPALTPAALK